MPKYLKNSKLGRKVLGTITEDLFITGLKNKKKKTEGDLAYHVYNL